MPSPRFPRKDLAAGASAMALLFALSGTWALSQQHGSDRHGSKGRGSIGKVCAGDLPPQAHETMEDILDGEPYPYDKDGTVFQNREGILPDKDHGYYHEFTVDTPGVDHRGARRIVTGGTIEDQVDDYWTDDHYQSFDKINYHCGKGDTSDRSQEESNSPHSILDPVCVNDLPDEAHDTIDLIWKHGDDGSKFPFPEKDGSVFEWRDHDPYPFQKKPDGYYREFTVITPGLENRGKLRIVTGGDPSDKVEDWWTADHYDTFHPIDYSCDDAESEGLKVH